MAYFSLTESLILLNHYYVFVLIIFEYEKSKFQISPTKVLFIQKQPSEDVLQKGCSMFLKVSQYSQKNSYIGVSLYL